MDEFTAMVESMWPGSEELLLPWQPADGDAGGVLAGDFAVGFEDNAFLGPYAQPEDGQLAHTLAPASAAEPSEGAGAESEAEQTPARRRSGSRPKVASKAREEGGEVRTAAVSQELTALPVRHARIDWPLPPPPPAHRPSLTGATGPRRSATDSRRRCGGASARSDRRPFSHRPRPAGTARTLARLRRRSARARARKCARTSTSTT